MSIFCQNILDNTYLVKYIKKYLKIDIYMKKILEDIGLNKNEALVYNTLLYKGEMIPSQIAEYTGITRANSYAILKSLVEKGVIEEIGRAHV